MANRDDGEATEGIEGGDAISDGSPFGDARMDTGMGDGGLVGDGSADGDAPACPPDDPAPPVVASTSTITFALANMSGSDRWLLTQSADCEAFSINGVITELQPQPMCVGDMYPPERLYFQKIAAGASANLTWDARGLVLYTTYQSCSPNYANCLIISNGSPQPVNPGQYTAQFAVASMAPTGLGSQCYAAVNGDVTCIVTTLNGMPQRGGQCTWSNVSLIQQTFAVPSSGDATVNVALQ